MKYALIRMIFCYSIQCVILNKYMIATRKCNFSDESFLFSLQMYCTMYFICLFLFYAIYSLCSYLMAYVVYLTMLNYVPFLCSFLVLLDYVCIIFSTLMHLSDLVSLMKLP